MALMLDENPLLDPHSFTSRGPSPLPAPPLAAAPPPEEEPPAAPSPSDHRDCCRIPPPNPPPNKGVSPPPAAPPPDIEGSRGLGTAEEGPAIGLGAVMSNPWAR